MCHDNNPFSSHFQSLFPKAGWARGRVCEFGRASCISHELKSSLKNILRSKPKPLVNVLLLCKTTLFQCLIVLFGEGHPERVFQTLNRRELGSFFQKDQGSQQLVSSVIFQILSLLSSMEKLPLCLTFT